MGTNRAGYLPSDHDSMIAHVLPNAGPQILTLACLIMANLVVGDILVEVVFALPGFGRLFRQLGRESWTSR